MPRISAKSSLAIFLSRRSNSPRVLNKIKIALLTAYKPWPKDGILSSNIEREEGKQFVMRVCGFGDGLRKTSQRTLCLTHSN